MSSPRRLEVRLSSSGYHMEVDTRKSDCNREAPHWHLGSRSGRVGSITPYGTWIQYPSVERRIMKEAEEITSRYSYEIRDAYEYNREHGSDY